MTDAAAVDRAVAGVDAVSHQAAKVGSASTSPTPPTTWRRTISARLCCWPAMAETRRRHVSCSPRRWWSTARGLPRGRPALFDPHPRSIADLDAGVFDPRDPASGAVLAPGLITEDVAARPAQRLRGHQARAGAPRRRVGTSDRRTRRGPPLPQRLRAGDAAEHARTPVSRPSSARPSSAARLPGSSRTAGSAATSCTSMTSPQRTWPPSTGPGGSRAVRYAPSTSAAAP